MKINVVIVSYKIESIFYFWLYGSYFLPLVSSFHLLPLLFLFSSICNIFNQALVVSYQNQKNRQKSKRKERGFLILSVPPRPFAYLEFSPSLKTKGYETKRKASRDSSMESQTVRKTLLGSLNSVRTMAFLDLAWNRPSKKGWRKKKRTETS